MPLVIKNNSVGLLALAIGAGAVSTTLQGGHTMPVLGAGDYCFATFVSASNTVEVVKVTAIVGNVITHAATTNAFDAGSRFELRPCKEAMDALMQEATAKAAVTLTGTDTYAGTAAPVPTSYVGIAWVLKFTNANTITTPSVNLNSLGAKTIKNRDGLAPAVGDIKAGSVHVAFYDGTNMILATLPSSAGIVLGQCRLSRASATSLLLSPQAGNLLTVNGANCTVPDGGTVSLAPTGLQPVLAITNRSITSNVATLTHAALSAAIPVGATVAVRDVGGASAYNGMKTVTASTTTTTSYAAVASNEGTTADTAGRVAPIYYIYATASAGAINALEASTTGWTISTTAGNKGVPIKSGDNTRTLVGMTILIAGPAWSDTAAQRFVINYWNRRGIDVSAAFTAGRSYSTGSFGEINSEIRNEFLTWGDEAINVGASGSYSGSFGGSSYSQALGIDGISPEDGAVTNNDASAGQNGSVHPFAVSGARTLAEGYHYVTLLANHVNGGAGNTGSYAGGAAGNARCAVRTVVRG